MHTEDAPLRRPVAMAGAGRPDLARVISIAFLLVLVLLCMLAGFEASGMAIGTGSRSLVAGPADDSVLLVTALVAPFVVLVVVVTSRLTRRESIMVLGILAMLLPPAASAGVNSSSSAMLRCLGLAVLSVGIVVSASAAGGRFLMRLSLIAGGFWGWASVWLGMMSVIDPQRFKALEPDVSGRYAQWMEFIHFNSAGQAFGALTGAAPSRQVLGVTTAVILVGHLHLLREHRRQGRFEWYLMVPPVGCAIALAWSMSRTGVVALVLGSGISLLAWQRFRLKWGVALLTAGCAVVLAIPVGLSVLLHDAQATSDTLAWRVSVWREYLNRPGALSALGIGPDSVPPLGAGHAHSQIVEMTVAGGFIGLAGLLVFLCIASWAALSSTRVRLRIAVGALTVFCVAGVFELPVTPRDGVLSPVWLVLLLSIGAAVERAAPRHRGQSRTAQPIER